MKKFLLAALLALLPLAAAAQGTTYSPSLGGVPGLSGDLTAITSTVPLVLPSTACTSTFLSFGDVDSGLCNATAKTTGIAVDGTEKFRVDSTVVSSFAANFVAYGNVYASSSDTYSLGITANLWQHLYLSRGIQGSKSKALSNATPVNFVEISIPQTAGSNYAGGSVIYTVFARNSGTDVQVLEGEAQVACLNNAGTESCAAIYETSKTAAVVTAGTLTCAITAVTGLTDKIALAANCDTSLTTTVFTIEFLTGRLTFSQTRTKIFSRQFFLDTPWTVVRITPAS